MEPLQILTIIFMALSFVSLPIYIFVLNVIWKHRNGTLKSSFFALSFSLGIGDVLYTVHKYIFHHGLRWFAAEEIRESVWVPTAVNMGIWGFFYVQMLGILLISINRFTALVLPLTYDNLWSRKVMIFVISLQWVLPFLFSLTMLHPKCHSHYDEQMEETIADNEIYWYGDVFVEAGLVAPTLIILYLIMFCKLRKHSREVQDSIKETQKSERKATGKNRVVQEIQEKMEYRLAIVGLIVTSLYMVQVGTFVLWAMEREEIIIDYIYYFANDIFTCINPILLILFSEKVRECVKIELGKFKCMLQQNVIAEGNEN